MRYVGYYVEKRTEQQVWLQDLQANLYTHLIYGFLGLNADGTLKTSHSFEQYKKSSGRLRNVNPELKISLSVDACGENSEIFSAVAAGEQLRRKFVDDVANMVEFLDVDGVDLYCDYPLKRCKDRQDKENIPLLLGALRSKLGENCVLSVGLAADLVFLNTVYDVSKIFEQVNFVNLLTVNMHSHADMRTGSSAPLNSRDLVNVESCLRGWLHAGAAAQKINMAVTSIAKTFTITSPYINFVGSPVSGPGSPGAYSNKPGEIDYYELLLTQRQPNWIVMWSEIQKIPYMYNLTQWVSFENYDSIEKKMKLATSLGIKGVAVWTVEADDMYGKTGMKYPFIRMVRDVSENCEKGN